MAETERRDKEQDLARMNRDLQRMQRELREDLNLRKNEELAAVRDALLPKLISGELRVRDLTPRIKALIRSTILAMKKAVFRNYPSATFLVASDRGRGVLKASWTKPSSYLKRSGPTKIA